MLHLNQNLHAVQLMTEVAATTELHVPAGQSVHAVEEVAP